MAVGGGGEGEGVATAEDVDRSRVDLLGRRARVRRWRIAMANYSSGGVCSEANERRGFESWTILRKPNCFFFFFLSFYRKQ